MPITLAMIMLVALLGLAVLAMVLLVPAVAPMAAIPTSSNTMPMIIMARATVVVALAATVGLVGDRYQVHKVSPGRAVCMGIMVLVS